MAFQLIPFFDEPSYTWDLMDWEPVPRRHFPASRSPLAQLDRLTRQLGRLQDVIDVHSGDVSLQDDRFRVNLNVNGFKPEDINVSLEDKTLTVTGKHEEKSEDGSRFSSRQFTRSYRLPDTAQLDQLKSTLAADGHTLRIEAPIVRPAVEAAAAAEQQKELPIEIHRQTVPAVKQG